MVLHTRLELKQSQSLVMTPQLQQAIKLLQLSNLELSAFVEQELQRNPLLEYKDENADANRREERDTAASNETKTENYEDTRADDWIDNPNKSTTSIAESLDTGLSNTHSDSGADAIGYGGENWGTKSGSFNRTEAPNLEHYVANSQSLPDHLHQQLQMTNCSASERMIAAQLIDMLDEQGYLREDLGQLAKFLGTSVGKIEKTLKIVQNFEPTGVFARNLKECLTLQLKEIGRFDPVIEMVLEHLDLLASHQLAKLKKTCVLKDEDLNEILYEIKSLNPRPGLKYGNEDVHAVVPDVFVTKSSDGSWRIELNNETLPKVLVNKEYISIVENGSASKKDKEYLQDCLSTANWLIKSLDQRARTILKVSKEIVRQQDGFFSKGIEHLKPLNLKKIAEAIDMHESTVSRVTSNKYMATNRGLYELKYFFTSAIQTSDDEDGMSSEAVRHKIRQLIDGETVKKILSDDKIVELLKTQNINIARRTVAKYREAMNIPSSVIRRRQKKMEQA